MSKIVLCLLGFTCFTLCSAQPGTTGTGGNGNVTCNPALIGVGPQYVVSCSSNPVQQNDFCWVSCAAGYTGRQLERICSSQDKWGGTDPQCSDSQNACLSFGCGINATCHDLPPPASNSSAGRVCACNYGFYGDAYSVCHLNTSVPCQNGYFSASGFAPCEACRVCPGGAVPTTGCTSTSNTVCPPRTDCGWISGDPHFQSLDGAYYDYQGAGEFFAIRSINDNSINIQTRFTPCAPGVTCMTGLSVGLTSDNVSIAYTATSPRVIKVFRNNNDVTSSLPLTINGVVFASAQSVYNVQQFTVTDSARGILITIQDYYYLSATFCVSTALYDQITGLLGVFDGNPNNDNPALQTQHSEFVVLSGGESWRVSQEESTTYYGVNQSYSSINDPSFVGITFPNNFQPSDTAQTACAGLTGEILQGCLQDVTTTNSANFATAANSFSQLVTAQNNLYNGNGDSSGAVSVAAQFCLALILILFATF